MNDLNDAAQALADAVYGGLRELGNAFDRFFSIPMILMLTTVVVLSFLAAILKGLGWSF